jgi:hypothetical protein
MLNWLHNKASPRKLRLFACACCHRIRPFLTDQRSRNAVVVAELYAEGKASDEELALARDEALQPVKNGSIGTSTHLAARAAFYATRAPVRLAARNAAGMTVGLVPAFGGQEQATLLRCIFGYVFVRRSIPVAWLAWNDGINSKLAQTIYERRAFRRLPILADALKEAGCDNADILNHCRQPGPHVRGCWVVDLLLGKT